MLDARVQTLPSIHKDNSYARVYRHATRASRVYRNLTHQFSVKATLLTEAFLNAFRQRHSFIAEETDSLLNASNEHQQQIAFLVTLESPSEVELNDPLFWTVRLQSGEVSLTPAIIKRISNKTKLELFFQGITPWSREYLLIFKPTYNAEQMRLVVGNARAKVRLDF